MITGAAGFIGSHLVDMALDKGYEVTAVDAMLEGSNKNNLNINSERWFLPVEELGKGALTGVDGVINCAALSNVDTSIRDPRAFESNVTSASNIAFLAMKKGIPLVHVSTDEEYGPYRWWTDNGRLDNDVRGYQECQNLDPTSAYAASKAAGTLMALSYFKTFGADIRVSRGANTYGTRQQDKLIPTICKKVLACEGVPIFKTPAKREWLHVLDHCSALFAILERGKAGEIYNVSSGEQRSPLEILKLLSPLAPYELVEDRKGYDLEYKIDSSKIRDTLGWEPQYKVDEHVPPLLEWYFKAFDSGYFSK